MPQVIIDQKEYEEMLAFKQQVIGLTSTWQNYLLQSTSIINRIKSIGDAYQLLKISLPPPTYVSADDFLNTVVDRINALHNLLVLAEALNEGWKDNWDDRNQKFIVEIEYISLKVFDCINRQSSPIVFKSRELAEHAIKIASDTFKTYFGIH